MKSKLTVSTRTLEICAGAVVTFKKGYQYGINIVKDENDDMAAESHNIWAMWRKNSLTY
jgi:hypothetical protein